MTERQLRKCTTSFTFREMQIKTTLRYHLTSFRMAKIKNTKDGLCWRGYRVRGRLLHCCWKCKLVWALWKSVWQFLRKQGINLPQDPSIPLWHIPKGYTLTPQGHLFNNAHSSNIHNSQNLETTQIPLNQRRDRENVVHLHNGVLLSSEK